MEPENHPCEKEKHLPKPSFLGSMLILRGVQPSHPCFTALQWGVVTLLSSVLEKVFFSVAFSLFMFHDMGFPSLLLSIESWFVNSGMRIQSFMK